MLDTAKRFAYNEDHEAFRDTVRKVFAEHMVPYLGKHEEEGIVGREAWKALGEAGMLCPTVAEENGGLGLDWEPQRTKPGRATLDASPNLRKRPIVAQLCFEDK